MEALSRRSYAMRSIATSWEEIWEAGPFYDRISEKLETAQEFAVFVGWQIDSRLPLKGQETFQETFKEKILRLCDQKPGFHFYFLIWDHAYLYVLERERWQGRIWDRIHPRVHFIFDNRHPLGGCHHEKICIIDGRTAFCGGIDLCADRWDTPEHLLYNPRRSLRGQLEEHGPYHDLAVQVEGPICDEMLRHVAARWRSISEIPFPEPANAIPPASLTPGHSVYLSRTAVPIEPTEAMPRPIREVEFLFRDLILTARKRIVLEGQYFWSRKINDLLIYKVLKMRGQDFELVLVLTDLERTESLTRIMAPYQLELLQRLQTAATSAGILFRSGTPRVFPGRPIYIHSKLLLVDDRFLSVGSANFASRALRLDTELHLTLEARSPNEKKHLQEVGKWVLQHWGFEANEPCMSIVARKVFPFPKPQPGPRIFWEYFFDPETPWSYLLKKRILRRFYWAQIPPFSCILLLWNLAMLLFLPAIGLTPKDSRALPFFLLLALSSVGWIRLPFLGILTLLCWTEGVALTVRAALVSIWLGGIASYAFARILPSSARRLCQKENDDRHIKRLGLRTPPALGLTLLDPRLSVHTKILHQGLYFLPFPWFILGTGVILPALILLWINLVELILKEIGPPLPPWDQILQSGLTAYLLARVARELTLRRSTKRLVGWKNASTL